MNIVIIGTGNVATITGRLILQSGHDIIEVYGRNETAALALAQSLEANAVTHTKAITKEADLYIIAVSDDAIKKIVSGLFVKDKIIVHTSGAVSKEVLKEASINYGVLYPLQSLRKEMIHLPVIPLFIDGSDDEVKSTLLSFASTLSNIVQEANDLQRLKLHIAAVFSSNFTNHLYALTETFCKHEQIDFKALYPLISETAERLKQYSPAQMQTGPAIREDRSTIEKHLEILNAYPHLKNIYTTLSENIRSNAEPT